MLIALPTSIGTGPVGRLPTRNARSCLASKRIVELVRFLNFILLLKLIFVQLFPRKTLHRTKKQNIPLLY